MTGASLWDARPYTPDDLRRSLAALTNEREAFVPVTVPLDPIPVDNLRRWCVLDYRGRLVPEAVLGCPSDERARRLQLGELPQLSRLSTAIEVAWRPARGPVS